MSGARAAPGAAPIELDGIHVRIASALVLDGVRLSVGAGERVAIVGANGAGKSTLLEVAVGVRRPDRGSVRVLGAPPPSRALGYVPQDAGASLLPWLSVRDNVELPLRVRGVRDRARAVERAAARADPRRTIDLDARPRALSGGQRQRAAIMRAIAGPPEVLVLDEPFSAIDAASRPGLRAMLRALCDERGVALLIVTHDPDDVRELGARVVRLDRPEAA